MRLFSIQQGYPNSTPLHWEFIPYRSNQDLYTKRAVESFIDMVADIAMTLGPVVYCHESGTAEIVFFRDFWGHLGGVARMWR